MNSGRNPTRRNRNLGTPKQGHGQDNRAGVPRCWLNSVLTWKRTPGHEVVTRRVWGRELPFVVEHTRADCAHASTVDDIAALLGMLPKRHVNNFEDILGIQGVVLRQPTRREQTHRPVWARLGYAVDVGPLSGPVIYLEAQAFPLAYNWTRKLSPDGQRELERLRQATSGFRTDKRSYHFEFDLDAVRRVQLYHSLPHEVGHWADMFESVELPSSYDPEEWLGLWERYWQRPSVEREDYAHSYAERATKELRAAGKLPFERLLDPESLVAEGLRLEDFSLGRE